MMKSPQYTGIVAYLVTVAIILLAHPDAIATYPALWVLGGIVALSTDIIANHHS